MRKFAMAAKKADKQAKACAAVVLRPIMWDVTRVWARRRLRASVTLDIMGYYGIFWDILGYMEPYVFSEGSASDGRKASQGSANQNVAGFVPRPLWTLLSLASGSRSRLDRTGTPSDGVRDATYSRH